MVLTFLMLAFTFIYASISHSRVKSLKYTLINLYFARFLGSVDAYC